MRLQSSIGSGVSRILLAILLCLIVFLGVPLPAYGIDNPDSMLTTDIHAYRHCLEDNDLLIIATYDIEYGSTPDETATEAFLFRILSGTTEVASISPYAYYNDGYGYGEVAIYFDATEASGLWGTSLTFQLTGNPTIFASPPSISTTDITWHATANQAATEAVLTQEIIAKADFLSYHWIVGAQYVDMTTQTVAGVKLSATGEAYLSIIIPSLRDMIPNAFSVEFTTSEYTYETYDQAYQTTLSGLWAGTGIDDSLTGIATWLGISSPTLTAIVSLLIAATAFGVAFWVGKSSLLGFLAATGVLIGATLIGWMPLAGMVIMALGGALVIGYVVFYRTA